MRDENGDNVFCEFCRYWRVKSEVDGVQYGACDQREIDGVLIKLRFVVDEKYGNANDTVLIRTRHDFGCNRFERRKSDE